MSKLVKKQMHHLQNGDVIYFVYRKNEPEQSEYDRPQRGPFVLFCLFIWVLHFIDPYYTALRMKDI